MSIPYVAELIKQTCTYFNFLTSQKHHPLGHVVKSC